MRLLATVGVLAMLAVGPMTAPTALAAIQPASTATGVDAAGAEGQSLTVSRTEELDPAGEQVTVTGTGFDENKGIYVALCVLPEPGGQPGPCLGGVDMEGESGASSWISSNPPPYGEGLATAYEPGGGFTVELTVQAQDQFTDCLATPCGVVTRTDHLRTADRSQDVLIPITFAEADAVAAGEEDVADAQPTEAAHAAQADDTSILPALIGGSIAVLVLVVFGLSVLQRKRAQPAADRDQSREAIDDATR